MRTLALLALAACSSSAPPPAQPVPAASAASDASVPVAPDAPPAPPPPPDISAKPDAYRFRFASPARTETWTLWFEAGAAIVTVQPANGALVTYQGTATEGATLAIAVQTSSAKLQLDCKRATREIEPACDAAAPEGKPTKTPARKPAKPAKKATLDALDCYVAGFAEPMPFARLPGIEYVAEGACLGYRAIAP